MTIKTVHDNILTVRSLHDNKSTGEQIGKQMNCKIHNSKKVCLFRKPIKFMILHLNPSLVTDSGLFEPRVLVLQLCEADLHLLAHLGSAVRHLA